jgi:hypothetical protein
MGERSRNLPRRSCLSVPGSSEKMMGKAAGLGADMVFLDLEDAVAPLEKEAARDKVVKAVNDLDWGDAVLCARVNAWDTEWTYRDVIHVVENASELTVFTSDEEPEQFDARVIGGDIQADLAVLDVDAEGLPAIPLGDSDALRLGEQVVALGYALGLEGGPSVTSGIVSSLTRRITVPDPG